MFCVKTPESGPQVYMHTYGELAVHNNVTFEANTAGSRGGAVSLPFAPSSVLNFDSFSRFWDFVFRGKKVRAGVEVRESGQSSQNLSRYTSIEG